MPRLAFVALLFAACAEAPPPAAPSTDETHARSIVLDDVAIGRIVPLLEREGEGTGIVGVDSLGALFIEHAGAPTQPVDVVVESPTGRISGWPEPHVREPGRVVWRGVRAGGPACTAVHGAPEAHPFREASAAECVMLDGLAYPALLYEIVGARASRAYAIHTRSDGTVEAAPLMELAGAAQTKALVRCASEALGVTFYAAYRHPGDTTRSWLLPQYEPLDPATPHLRWLAGFVADAGIGTSASDALAAAWLDAFAREEPACVARYELDYFAPPTVAAALVSVTVLGARAAHRAQYFIREGLPDTPAPEAVVRSEEDRECLVDGQRFQDVPPPEPFCFHGAVPDELTTAIHFHVAMQNEEAAAVLQRYLAITPTETTRMWWRFARALLAEISSRLHRDEAAREMFLTIFRDPDDPYRWYAAGWLCDVPRSFGSLPPCE